MKQKFYIVVALLLFVFIVPSIALAAWWNPFSWNWNNLSLFSKPKISLVDSNKNPVISRVLPFVVSIGSTINIQGKNFDPLGAYVGNGWDGWAGALILHCGKLISQP